MLATYQAKLHNNQLIWKDESPTFEDVEVIVTVLPNQSQQPLVEDTIKKPKRQPPNELKGLISFNGDIINVEGMTAQWGVE